MVDLDQLWTILDLLVGIFGLSVSNCVGKLAPEALGTVSGRFRKSHFSCIGRSVWSNYGKFPDPLVGAAGFYGSESSPKMASIRPETVRGPVFGRVAEKCEGF